ncbi:MAG: mannose-1-phosphate guanylyltransferase/mannose-6-phosphate isomerase [Rhodospirillaceae bacterium]|nr:mannose-1-phosphate guanylyltransferase/mannose-6-phosphate isomerase [Rhodospirillaceae bacterium]
MKKRSVIHPVILGGGIGKRLWPLSRELYPKQFHRFNNNNTLFQQTAQRLSGSKFSKPIVVCNFEHRFLVADQLRLIGLEECCIVLEPIGKNTAAASIIAALVIQQKYSGGLMLISPSDHLFEDTEGMRKAVESAVKDAIGGSIIVFGVTPDRPHTGFGYIKCRNQSLDGGSMYVESFIEKPNLKKAELYFEQESYYWNSGVFFCDSKQLIIEMEKYEPELVEICRESLKASSEDLDFLRLNPEIFSNAKNQSLDYALMEKTNKAAMIPIDVGWNDLGSWQALWEETQGDDQGNVISGPTVALDSSNNYLNSNGPLLAVSGIDDLVVIATSDAILVVPRAASEDVRELVNDIENAGFQQFSRHDLIQRPWGSFEILHLGSGYQVKKLTLKPNSSISLQYHNQRAEHWVVVAGRALVLCETSEIELGPNQSTYIPVGSKHRLTNNGSDELIVIEVQTGEYLGEDDIIRLEDLYGRETF